jgi:hypothetical protein
VESQTLVQQANHNIKEQFSNSPALTQAILDAIIDAFEAHTTMSKQALDSEQARDGLKEVLSLDRVSFMRLFAGNRRRQQRAPSLLISSILAVQ